MPPKRKAVEIEERDGDNVGTKKSITGKVKKQKKSAEDEEQEQQQEQTKVHSKATSSAKKNKKPTSLKEKILHLLSLQDKLIGLASIKKILKEDYDIEDNKANNNRINKTLKELSEEEGRDDFGKVGGSYHGGVNSPAYQEYAEQESEKEAKRKAAAEHPDDFQCPYCDAWNDALETWRGEDSIARGSKF